MKSQPQPPPPALTQGAKIRVYQKPFTREAFEDVAVLVRKTSGLQDGFEQWHVRFPDERHTVPRTVHPRDLLSTRNNPGILKRRGRHAPSGQ